MATSKSGTAKKPSQKTGKQGVAAKPKSKAKPMAKPKSETRKKKMLAIKGRKAAGPPNPGEWGW